jgi:HD-GYP domain-containing protein (c-di-GMP phosphodiesterase class II)
MQHELLTKLFSQLDMLILERVGDRTFRALEPLPPFAERLFPEPGEPSEGFPCQASPFLEFFVDEARDHWTATAKSQLWSEFWTETDPGGEEHALQAAALTIEDTDCLVVFHLARMGADRQELLQQARNNLLLQRYLETEVDKRTQTLQQREEEIVHRLIGAADYRDEETGTHIRRMSLYSALMARHLGWSSMMVHKMQLAASMHDVGKIGIPDGILLKPGRLNEAEFTIMQSHTLIGGKILADSKADVLRMAYDIAMGHHENWDGSGYPNNLAGEAIPLAARVVAVCDVFDALAHDRVYRMALPVEQALGIMHELRGVKFEPRLHDLFVRLLPEILEIKDQYRDEGRQEYTPIWAS